MHKPPLNRTSLPAVPHGDVEPATAAAGYRGSNLCKFDPDPSYAPQGWRPSAAIQLKSGQDAGSVESSAPLSSSANSAEGASDPNGLPSRLRSGIETLSGMDLSDVVVHRNSPEPARLSALAYAKGNDIYLGAGQEQHLPHEAWHVVQQRQGRVRPTLQMKGIIGVNDDAGLEQEADQSRGIAYPVVDQWRSEHNGNEQEQEEAG